MRCEAFVAEALLIAPDDPEPLQTLASIRISQLRIEDAKAALSRSLELWRYLETVESAILDFPLRISLTRLLIEAEMEVDAVKVANRLVDEDDMSVEAWYLLGWCYYLLSKKESSTSEHSRLLTGAYQKELTDSSYSQSLVASRKCLKHCLLLFRLLDYEDDRLMEHASELVEELQHTLGLGSDEETDEDDDDWEDEDEEVDEDDEDDEEGKDDGDVGSKDEVMDEA